MSARLGLRMELKIPFEGVDRNGYTYSKEALEDAVERFNKSAITLPLLVMLPSGEHVQIGDVVDLQVDGCILECEAFIPEGGTCEVVPGKDDEGREGMLIEKMDIKAVSIVGRQLDPMLENIFSALNLGSSIATGSEEKEGKENTDGNED